MKNIKFYLLIPGVFFLAVSCNTAQGLFQETAVDWFTTGAANWTYNQNELIGNSKNGTGFAVTCKSYKDFILELEFKPDDSINSGVFIRCEREPLNASNCYEINIWDVNPNQEYRTGSVVRLSVPLASVETINKWNTYKIKSEKSRLQIWVNTILTIDTQDTSHTEGFVGLQAQGVGEIKFRNITIKDLK